VAILPALDVWGGLVVLFVATVPLGTAVLRALEKAVGRHWPFTPLERILVAFYGAGGVLFAVASVPLPLFFPAVVVGLLVGGVLAFVVISVREQARGVREFFRWLRTAPAIVLGAGTAGLLALYVLTIGTLDAANGLDGPVHALFTMLLLRNHTVPTTLMPYELAGVEYTQGSPVWESLPAILYGWPVIASPVILPALFLSLTPAAAFCWGDRAGATGTPRGARMGLLFAGFFGLLASWPRLFVGGSFDFMFALPLFLLVLGWLPGLLQQPLRPWRETLATGVLVGVTASLSVSIGLELVLLLGAGWLVYLWHSPRSIGDVAARFAAILLVGAGFLVRSLYGIILWFGYPGHVLSAAGSPPYALSAYSPPAVYRFVTGELDPFILRKFKLSPIPYLSLELACLLALGFILVILWLRGPRGSLGRLLPAPLVRSICLGTATSFVFVSFLVVIEYATGPLALIRSVTYIEEYSFLLFIFYGAIALLPLVASLNYLEAKTLERSPPGAPPHKDSTSHSVARARTRRSNRWAHWGSLAAAIVLAQPLAIGVVATTTAVPQYLTTHVEEFANVTPADFQALRWAGSNLPSCARVLVAPGSAARYLPLFASVFVITLEPYLWNLSYNDAVEDLSAGVFDGSTQSDLLSIQATEVFVTGQTSVQFPPFVPSALENSSDFTTLFHVGDAYIFAFLPGLALTGCTA